jgi:hypothetical protein
MGQGKGSFVCIDFGLTSLAVVEVSAGRVGKWLSQPLPRDVVRQGDPAEPDALGAQLRQAMSAVGMTARRARVVLADESVVTKVVELPRMPRRHLKSAMRYVAERELPLPLDRACWTWALLERTPVGASVCLVGAWQDVVDRVVEAIRAAGLQPEVLEPRSMAIARALGLDHAVVLESAAPRVQATLIHSPRTAHVEHGLLGSDPQSWPAVTGQLLQRVLRHHAATSTSAVLPPVLTTGEVAAATVPMQVRARDAAEVLNGHPPARPAGFPASGYLANLGLAMRK